MSGPLLFAPLYHEKIWGGRTLETLFHRKLPTGLAVGESWEISGYGSTQSSVESPAPLAGTPLNDLCANLGDGLLGTSVPDGPFPLLYKLIDAHDRLSIQVHPTDEQAVSYGWDSRGKTECWYVAHADPGARIIVGFSQTVSREAIAEHIRANTLSDILNEFDVATGDVLFIPAGTVHAIMEGVVLYEVQETSDCTLRLYDWGRVGADGHSRPLHIEDGLKVLDRAVHDRHRIEPVSLPSPEGILHRLRAACSYFALEEWQLSGSAAFDLPCFDSFSVVTVMQGGCTLPGSDLPPCLAGRTILFPADCVTRTITATEPETVLLHSWVPDLLSDIIMPLRQQGVSDDLIAALGGQPRTNDLLPALNCSGPVPPPPGK